MRWIEDEKKTLIYDCDTGLLEVLLGESLGLKNCSSHNREKQHWFTNVK